MKGIGFTNARAFVIEKFGAVTYDVVLEQVSASDRMDIEAVVPVGWYDVYLFGRLLHTIDRICGDGDLKLLKSVGAFEAEHDFNRAVRMLLRVTSPEYVFKTHKRLWSHFQKTGEWTIESQPMGMKGILTDWAVDLALCTELSGYLARLLEFTGGRNVAVEHPVCRARDGENCTFKFRWT